MLRSMYAGVSGMRGFQTKLDVIGNNIANVGTVGFKKGRVTFQDMMSQTTSSAQGPTANRGGMNPKQVGLGSQLGTIDTIHTQGFQQRTDVPLDLALEGDGMFAVRLGGSTAYTRAGNFGLDASGNIVNPDGYELLGFSANEVEIGTAYTAGNIEFDLIDGNITNVVWRNEHGMIDSSVELDGIVDFDGDSNTYTFELSNGAEVVLSLADDPEVTIQIPEEEATSHAASEETLYEATFNEGTPVPLSIPITAESFSIQSDGTITYIDGSGAMRTAGKIAIATFSNPSGLEKAGNNLYTNSPNAGYNGLFSPDTAGVASIASGSIEMSNVDLAEEFTEMITAQRGFQANTRIITTSDEILQELVNLKR